MDLFIFFSEILGKKVIDQNDDLLGTLCDVGMNVGKDVYPKSSHLVIKKGFLVDVLLKFHGEKYAN